jgi:YD repeat-containing protein
MCAMSGYVTYEYDSLGNLIISWDSAGIKEDFTYDLADNRTQTEVTTGAPPPPPAMQAAALFDGGDLEQAALDLADPVPLDDDLA